MTNRLKLLSYNVYSGCLDDLNLDSGIISTINPHSYCVAKGDFRFKKSLLESDVLLPDGVGFVLAARILEKKKIKKISGFDLHLHFLTLLKAKGEGKVFYLGASENTLALIRNRLFDEFPMLQVETYSPPFKSEFSFQDNKEMIARINLFQPDVLFVGMTAPKQEKWVYQHKDLLNVKVVCSIGAVFDFFAGTVPRAPKWMIDLGLEWVHRSIKNKRLLKRNLVSNPKFVMYIIKEKFK